eukprot:TRINITY_DN27331_c0_g1_i1.p1 TRINITY_DN27331_c0_g1~~TRINITY_DN27331_c0_g1_i1.p1  ORF type:complete len:369 (-),score=68.99 TRINITY_DN27331_c0_g1_i1:62-1105(-)
MACQNCLTVVGLGCTCCCDYGCSSERTRTALAFSPPDPPTYKIEDDKEGGPGRVVYLDDEIRSASFYLEAAAAAEVYWARPRKRHKVPVIWIRCDRYAAPPAGSPASPSGSAPLVILFCHGNAADIGSMMGHFLELSAVLRVDVVGVEYTGYGAAEGNLHTSHIGEDIEAAYTLITGMGVAPERIIVYGQSVGSAAAVQLAAAWPVGGLILHSPLASGLQVLDGQSSCCRPSTVICCFDVFRNDLLLPTVTCPVLIMHGECDEIVHVRNARKLQRMCNEAKSCTTYFVPQAGHNDLMESDSSVYFERLAKFLGDVRQSGQKAVSSKPEQAWMDREKSGTIRSLATVT